jgi:aspartyl-tRNA(Asn)/glutamyl-tRNA(Gln) amidotransferase subunit A
VTPVPGTEGSPFDGVAALSERIRRRELSPVALAEACLERIDRLQPRLGAFVTVTPERALADARAAEAELARGHWRGPLHGVPYGLEDVIDTAGIRTTLGAAPFADRVPERDAVVASRLRDAGAVLVGKLSTIELAGGLGYTSPDAALNGACRNPWDPERWAGGASCGPAAAVGAGLLAFAVAHDTWGSITAPSAFCGVTGLRPTFGVVPRRGALQVAFTVDALGAVSRTAQDCALVLAGVAGPDARDPASAPLPRALDRVRPALPAGLRVAALRSGDAPVEERDAVSAARALLAEGGAIVEDAALPDVPYRHVLELLVAAEAANAFEDLLRSGGTRALADPSHRARTAASYVPEGTPADYVRAMRVRAEAQRALARLFERHDLVLAPNRPAPPPPVGARFASPPRTSPELDAAAALAGLPSVAFPAGLAEGMPLSVQLVGAPFGESRLLSVAAWLQARDAFRVLRPPEAETPAPGEPGPPAAAPAPVPGTPGP